MDETEGCYSTLYNGKNSAARHSAQRVERGGEMETWAAWQDKGQCGCQTFLFDHSYNLGRRPLYSLLVTCFVKAAGIKACWAGTRTCQDLEWANPNCFWINLNWNLRCDCINRTDCTILWSWLSQGLTIPTKALFLIYVFSDQYTTLESSIAHNSIFCQKMKKGC